MRGSLLVAGIISLGSIAVGVLAHHFVTARPRDHWERVREARAYLERGQLDRAFAVVSQVRDNRPGAAEAVAIAAEVLMARGFIADAKRTFDRSLAMNPDQAGVCKYLAAICLASGEGQRGADLLARAARIDPADFRPWYALGKVYHDLGRISDSADAYERALKLDAPPPLDRECYAGLARARLDLNDFEAARAALSPALGRWPDAAELLGQQARLALAEGNTEEAIRAADAALERDASHFDALLVRGKARNLRGELDDALRDLDRATELNQNHLEALQIKGQVEARLGRQEEANVTAGKAQRARERLAAMDALTKAINEWPDDPEPRFQMGELAAEARMDLLAYQCFQAALGIDPKYAPARRALQELESEGRLPREATANQEARAGHDHSSGHKHDG